MIQRKVELEVKPSIQELAKEFTELNADDMAVFFDFVGIYSDEWKSSLSMQLQMVCESGFKNNRASAVMSKIGEYA